ncbi:type I restriction-modification system subunit M, partial [Escherichia coli]
GYFEKKCAFVNDGGKYYSHAETSYVYTKDTTVINDIDKLNAEMKTKGSKMVQVCKVIDEMVGDIEGCEVHKVAR